MSDQSSADLEREAEVARAQMAGTAETIRRKLTAGQLFDEFSGLLTGGDLAGGLSNLKHQVRDNPLPVALVGAGLAWLAFGKGMSGHESRHGGMHSAAAAAPPPGAGYAGHSEGSARGGSVMSSVAGGARSVADGARSAAGSAKSAAESVSDTVSSTFADVTDSLTETADRLRHSMLSGTSHTSHRAAGAASRLMHDEPLVIAALGVALGAAVGAMLPASELEKEQIGPYAGRLRDGAKNALDKGMHSASTVASKAYDAVKDEADRQGLAPGEGRSVGERLGEVVKSAARSTEEATREEMGGKNETDQRTS